MLTRAEQAPLYGERANLQAIAVPGLLGWMQVVAFDVDASGASSTLRGTHKPAGDCRAGLARLDVYLGALMRIESS